MLSGIGGDHRPGIRPEDIHVIRHTHKPSDPDALRGPEDLTQERILAYDLSQANYLEQQGETTMPNEENNQKGRNLDTMLGQASASWTAYKNSAVEESKWNILNKLVFILGADAPTFVFASHTEGDGEGSGKIAVFTDTYLLYGEGAMNELSFKLIPLADLEGVEVLSVARNAGTDWSKETETKILLSFKHGARVTLPPGPEERPSAEVNAIDLFSQFKNQLTSSAR